MSSCLESKSNIIEACSFDTADFPVKMLNHWALIWWLQVITEALPKSVGSSLIGLVTSRDEIPDLLKVNNWYWEIWKFLHPPCLCRSYIIGRHHPFVNLWPETTCYIEIWFWDFFLGLGAQLDDVIDLVIPRGSNKLVSDIKAATKIPVLGHAGQPFLSVLVDLLLSFPQSH